MIEIYERMVGLAKNAAYKDIEKNTSTFHPLSFLRGLYGKQLTNISFYKFKI